MTRAELAELLHTKADAAGEGNSFEGTVTYTCISPQEHTQEELEGGKYEVTVFYRVGDREGQGGGVTTVRRQERRTDRLRVRVR
jgi:hypothetical protein